MDFNAMFQVCMAVITSPGEEVFEQERQRPIATLSTAMLWMLIAAVISAILGSIGVVIQFITGFSSIFSQFTPQSDAMMQGVTSAGLGVGIITTFCTNILFIPIFFLIGSGMYFGVAKLFGGSGDFEEQTYLLATFGVPLTIISSALNVIPVAGGCLSIFVLFYQLYLTYFALKVSHNLSGGQAIGAVITPIIVVFICTFCFVAGGLVLLGPVISEVFQELQQPQGF